MFIVDYGDATTSPSDRCDDNNQSPGSLSTDQNSTNSNVKRKQRRYRYYNNIYNARLDQPV